MNKPIKPKEGFTHFVEMYSDIYDRTFMDRLPIEIKEFNRTIVNNNSFYGLKTVAIFYIKPKKK